MLHIQKHAFDVLLLFVLSVFLFTNLYGPSFLMDRCAEFRHGLLYGLWHVVVTLFCYVCMLCVFVFVLCDVFQGKQRMLVPKNRHHHIIVNIKPTSIWLLSTHTHTHTQTWNSKCAHCKNVQQQHRMLAALCMCARQKKKSMNIKKTQSKCTFAWNIQKKQAKKKFHLCVHFCRMIDVVISSRRNVFNIHHMFHWMVVVVVVSDCLSVRCCCCLLFVMTYEAEKKPTTTWTIHFVTPTSFQLCLFDTVSVGPPSPSCIEFLCYLFDWFIFLSDNCGLLFFVEVMLMWVRCLTTNVCLGVVFDIPPHQVGCAFVGYSPTSGFCLHIDIYKQQNLSDSSQKNIRVETS